VKKLFADGFSISEISNTIGERDDKNTFAYVHSQISSLGYKIRMKS